MPRAKIVSLLRIFTGLLVLAIAILGSSSRLWAQGDQTPGIVGSWILTVPNDPGEPPDHVPLILNAGGTGLIAVDNNRIEALAWKQTGDREFAFTSIQYRKGQGGQGAITIEKIRGVMKLNDAGDSLDVTVKAETLSLDGTVLDSFSGTINAKRIQVEPL